MTFGNTLPFAAFFTLALLPSASPPASAQAPNTPAPNNPAPNNPAPAAPPAAPAPPATGTVPADQKPPQQKKHGFQIPKVGINYDVFLPSSGKTRSRFGSSWGGIGIGIGRPDTPSGKGLFAFDFSTQYQHSGDHHAFVAPIGISYRRAFNSSAVAESDSHARPTFIPYYGVTANLVVVDLRSPQDNVHSRFRLTEGASVLIGTTIGKSGFAEGRYRAIGKVQGFDLSGIKLAVGIRF